MLSKTWMRPKTTFTEVLANASFGELHHGIVEADVSTAWRLLNEFSWADLTYTRGILRLRSLGLLKPSQRPWINTFAPPAIVEREQERSLMFVMVGKPWSPVPQSRPLDTLEDIKAFEEPGWLKYGMEWRLTDLGNNRTLMETRTLCEPTSDNARRLFGTYWLAVRPLGGLIRRDIIATIRRTAAAAPA